MIRTLKKMPTHWAGINLQGLFIGIIIGSIINIFAFLFSDFRASFSHMMATYMFSIVISLSISNVICFAKYILSKNLSGKWLPFVTYYGGCVLGMIIGTELSYILLWQFWGAPYVFLGHPDQIAFNLTIAVMVCSILFIYETQKSKYALKISQQELEVIKLKQLKTQADLQTLQSKINPHFLYNSLNSIALLIHEDAEKAEEMTLKLSKLFRYSINSRQENFATIREEIEIVDTYFDIEKIRFGDRINFISEVSDSVLDKHIPRFLIQPLVENSLKHGLADKMSDAILRVRIDLFAERLVLSVADNGVPFPDELNAGYGLQSTFDKLTLLYQDDYEIEFINTPEKFIRISLPMVN